MKTEAKMYIGWHVLVDERDYTVSEISVGHDAVTLVDGDGVDKTIRIKEFRDLAALELAYDPDENANDRKTLTTTEAQEVVQFRLSVLKRTNSLRFGDQLIWSATLAQLDIDFADHPIRLKRGRPFSKRTIQEWQRNYRLKGDAGLRPKTKKCGNRTPRFDEVFEEITRDVLDQSFFSSDRMTITEACNIIRKRYQDACIKAGILPGPCGVKAVLSIIRRLPHADVVKMRLGSGEARRQYLLAMQIQKVSTPLERVEIDCTTLDIFCTDDEGEPIGRPTVCVALDCATGVPLGMQLGLGAPTQSLVARTLKECMSPTDSEFFDKHNIENRHSSFGKPQVVISDNGSEFSGLLIKTALVSSGIEWRKCVPGQPDKKPFVERFFLELSRFITRYPGATQTKCIPAKRRTEIAQKEACYTLQEIETILQVWRYDVYLRKSRRRVENVLRTQEAPMQSWDRLSRETFLPLAPTLHQLRGMFMVDTATRVAQHDGIRFKNIVYASFELANYLKRVEFPCEVRLRIDPNDIREIAVYDETLNEHFFVQAKDEDCPAISFDELDRIRRHCRSIENDELDSAALVSAMQLEEIFNPKEGKTALKRRHNRARGRARRDEVIEKTLEKIDPKNLRKTSSKAPALGFSMPSNLPSFVNSGTKNR
ncbi:transposase family protein [Tropicimonas sp. TH_r6]|uniref:transposase family protein n=1 Tax=Tropicimonas sp. TH_r6 TaxID=3082085 RepID=UPI00295442F9|nr:transposase family protein [Tropicimonas sp. TH_r6]MDV7144760.1 transposase family protein [Tropicimonas sp. TH_r6]